tara:strand:+ start:1153 stop:1293 length:141 start_codon:yes stop_codon:yes gene_type:complete
MRPSQDEFCENEILRGVYPERGKKRFFALLRMTSEGLRPALNKMKG